MIRRRQRRPARGTFEAINITPFTDVLLVLLIIFMIAGSSMVPTALAVNELAVPGSSAGETFVSDRLVVWLAADGQAVAEKDGERLSSKELDKLSRSTPVTLRVAPEASAEAAINEYERWREQGFAHLSWGAPGRWKFSDET